MGGVYDAPNGKGDRQVGGKRSLLFWGGGGGCGHKERPGLSKGPTH